MRSNKFKVLLIILFLTELVSVFLTYKSFSNREIAEIKENYEVDKRNFAMFINDGNDNYVEYTSSNLFPEGYEINVEKSKCVDTKGNVIDGILSGSGTNITVKSTTTSYCYLYFDIGKTDTEKLIENVSSDVLWESTLEDDGYRFVGTDPANYICFGTTDTSTCTGNTDLYMYRIIGIFEDSSEEQHLKLIKKEALNTSYKWNSDYETDIDWDESGLYNGINGSYFLTNSTYSYMQDTNWTDKIATWNYTSANTKTYENYSLNSVYGPRYYYNKVNTVYLHEMNRYNKTNQTCYYNLSTTADCNAGEWTTTSTKISLMYLNDYLLSLGSSAIDYAINSQYSTLKTGWMHISNNDSKSLSTTSAAPPSTLEWTMTSYGADSNSNYQAWYSAENGSVNYGSFTSSVSVRPVFYLTTNVTISGEGTSTKPYIIS